MEYKLHDKQVNSHICAGPVLVIYKGRDKSMNSKKSHNTLSLSIYLHSRNHLLTPSIFRKKTAHNHILSPSIFSKNKLTYNSLLNPFGFLSKL